MRIALGLALGSLVVAPLALGHGVQIQFTYNPATGKVESRQIVATTTSPTPAEPVPTGLPLVTAGVSARTRVYVLPMANEAIGAGAGWYAQPSAVARADIGFEGQPAYPTGPGLAYEFDSTALAGGTADTNWAYSGSTTLPNLQGTNFSYKFTTGLLRWNGAALVDPGAAQVELFRGDGTSAITSSLISADTAPAAGLALAAITATSTNPHSSLGMRLLGDGATVGSTSPDGVYVIGMQVASTAAGVGASDPFYYVLAKNVPYDSALVQANAFATANGIPLSQVQAVPEPGALAAVGVAALAARRARRRPRPV